MEHEQGSKRSKVEIDEPPALTHGCSGPLNGAVLAELVCVFAKASLSVFLPFRSATDSPWAAATALRASTSASPSRRFDAAGECVRRYCGGT